ncbi:DUF808 domain-containing protein [Alcaligenaceae bacterium]|nr:DUF808 domain-containing protein [Alcaligenaceae bacterium]
MAAGSLLALLDDITTVLDDVALLTKMAGKKTAGVLGDDIALNAQQVSGSVAHRELPVVWAVAKGSFLNKLILVPVALAISVFLPIAIVPLLMIGGIYLCYEGVEKVLHSLFHAKQKDHPEIIDPALNLSPPDGGPTPEETKIKGAIRTDFILSAEIVAITLGTVAQASFTVQATVVTIVAIAMTVGVYGFVAGVVKLDDAGLHLQQRQGQGAYDGALRMLGTGILAFAPYLMKGLSIAGTAAMFLVGGGILVHGIPGAEITIHHILHIDNDIQGLGEAITAAIGPMLFNAMIGIAAGAVALGIVKGIAKLRG